jgi:hypothetical protein
MLIMPGSNMLSGISGGLAISGVLVSVAVKGWSPGARKGPVSPSTRLDEYKTFVRRLKGLYFPLPDRNSPDPLGQVQVLGGR